MPPFNSAPFCRAAPERILPVWPGWMPTPRACLLKRPLTTLIFVFNGARGLRQPPNSIASPEPLAHHSLGLTPQPMNMAANRLGMGATAPPAADATRGPSDSSKGRATVTPAPRRNARRVDP